MPFFNRGNNATEMFLSIHLLKTQCAGYMFSNPYNILHLKITDNPTPSSPLQTKT